MSALKQERFDASKVLDGPKIQQVEDKKAFIQDVKKAVCSLCSAIEDNESVLLSKLSFSAALKEFALWDQFVFASYMHQNMFICTRNENGIWS